MPRNGSGGYSAPQNSWNPAINNMAAKPDDWMAILNDVAAALQASLAADGQTPITGLLNFGENRILNVGSPLGSGDALRFEQLTKGTDVPSATTIAFSVEGSLFDVTGTTTITGIAPSFPGHTVLVRFKGVLTLTNGANLILPGGANITTHVDDLATFICLDGTVWKCRLYTSSASLTNTTPGLLLKVGDWGIGGLLQSLNGLDILADDNLTAYYGTSLLNTPPDAPTTAGYVTKRGRSSVYREVTFVHYSGSGRWVNYCNNGTWTGWHRSLTDADIGTAALANVTTSPTDTTPGRVLRVGDLGSQLTSSSGDAGDWNSMPSLYPWNGFVPVLKTTTAGNHGPGAAGTFWFVEQAFTPDGTVAIQIAYPHAPAGQCAWQRSRNSGVWSAWFPMGPVGGPGMTWRVMDGSRNPGVNYTNTTGRPIMVNVTCSGGNPGVIQVDGGGFAWASYTGSSTPNNTASVIVPPNSTYNYSTSFFRWAELTI